MGPSIEPPLNTRQQYYRGPPFSALASNFSSSIGTPINSISIGKVTKSMVPYTPVSASSFDINTPSLTTPLNGGSHNKSTEAALSINKDDTTYVLLDVPALFVPGDVLKIAPKWAEINYETGYYWTGICL